MYHAFKADRHADLYALHQRHGPVVRFGPNHISINSASALEDIYGHKANVQKSSWYGGFYSISIFNAIDRNVHARKKRVMSQAFSDQATREMEPCVLSVIRNWCKAIGDTLDRDTVPDRVYWSRPKDMAHWSACMIFDVLGEICFGKSFETSLKPDNHFFFSLMKLNVRILDICGQMPILKRLGLEAFLRRGTAANRTKQIAFSREQLNNRLTTGESSSKRRDIIHFLQLARDPETGSGYSQQELVSEVTLLLGAGRHEPPLTSCLYGEFAKVRIRI